MDNDAQRKAFEVHFESTGRFPVAGCFESDLIFQDTKQALWAAWQESRKQALEEAAKACESIYDAYPECAAAIRAL